MTRTLRVAGVPEHFNTPWKRAVTSNELKKLEISLEFKEYPSGTGAMCSALTANEVDVALLLTEGAVAYALNTNDTQNDGNKVKLFGIYVDSPLYWGVHVGSASPFNTLKDLVRNDMNLEPTFAISRYGSGSHLMAYVLMQKLLKESGDFEAKWDGKFEVVKDLKGAKDALNDPKNAHLVFMWEKFMTAPVVKEGIFKLLGIQPTPWPCFVMAVRESFLDSTDNKETLKKVVAVVHSECDKFKNGGLETVAFLEKEFHIERDLARQWLDLVSFKCTVGLKLRDLRSTAKTLFELEKLDKDPTDEAVNGLIATF